MNLTADYACCNLIGAANILALMHKNLSFYTIRIFLASRPGLLLPQSIKIHTHILHTLITRGVFSEGEGLEDFRT